MLIPGIIPSLALSVQGLHPQENSLFPSPGASGREGKAGEQPHSNTRVDMCTHLRVPTTYVHACAHAWSHVRTAAQSHARTCEEVCAGAAPAQSVAAVPEASRLPSAPGDIWQYLELSYLGSHAPMCLSCSCDARLWPWLRPRQIVNNGDDTNLCVHT